MAQKSIKGNEELARRIKQRRNELNLTIEEAALRAGVGTKTWSRYEAGGSIRLDKCKGLCRALNWKKILDYDEEDEQEIPIQEYKESGAWSCFLENTFGIGAAISFVIGSDILSDYIREDMAELSSRPAGTHIGQLDISCLNDILPKQFLMNYNYKFLYQMQCILYQMRGYAKNNISMTPHSVMEELILYLCCEEASVLIELNDWEDTIAGEEYFDIEDWVFDLLGDMDIISFLYSNKYLDSNHPYHFLHWADQYL